MRRTLLVHLAALAAVAGLWIATARPGRAVIYPAAVLQLNLLATVLLPLLAHVLAGPERRRRAGQAVLCVLAMAFVFLLLEAPAALGVLDWRAVLGGRRIGHLGPQNQVAHPEFLFHRQPGDRLEYVMRGEAVHYLGADTPHRYQIRAHYDSNGFRNSREYGTADVVLLGDSFVEGYGVTQEEILSRRLERRAGLDVVNLSQSGYGPGSQLAVLRNLGLDHEPERVVWFFYGWNDLEELEAYERAMDDWEGHLDRTAGFGRRSFRQTAVSFLNAWIGSLRNGDAREARRRSGRFGDRTLYFSAEPPALTEDRAPLLDRAVERIAKARDLCAEAGADFLVLSVPVKFEVYRGLCDLPEGSECAGWEPSPIAARLGERLRARGIPFRDLLPALRAEAARGRLLYHADDSHWSREGHDVVAAELAKILEDGR